MKNHIFFFLVLTNFSCTIHSQDSVFFKIQYYPERTYKTITNHSSETKISYTSLNNNSGKEAPIEPSNMNLSTISETTMMTGRLVDGDYFPLIIKTVALTGDSMSEQRRSESIYYGKSTIDNKITIDSFTSNKELDEMNEYILEETQNHYSQITFPGKHVKIGDTLWHEMPYSIMYDDITDGYISNTIYLLERIDEGIATFSMEYTMKSKNPDSVVHGIAQGTGRMRYDMTNQFYIDFQLKINSEVNSNIAGINMKMTSNSHFSAATSISQN